MNLINQSVIISTTVAANRDRQPLPQRNRLVGLVEKMWPAIRGLDWASLSIPFD
jgi:hypothetical protein